MRAINFDMSIKKLEKYYSAVNPKGAYKDIRDFLQGMDLSIGRDQGIAPK